MSSMLHDGKLVQQGTKCLVNVVLTKHLVKKIVNKVKWWTNLEKINAQALWRREAINKALRCT